MSYAKLGTWMDPDIASEYLSLSLKGVILRTGKTGDDGTGYVLKQEFFDGDTQAIVDEWKDCAGGNGPGGGSWNNEELDAHVYDTGRSIVIKAELPGIKKNDIRIDMMDNVLTIRIDNYRANIAGEKATAGKAVEDTMKKSFVLPKNVFLFPEMVKATFADGVFVVEILKCSKT